MSSSALFAPYRAIGLVCDGKQLFMHNQGSQSFVTTSIGKAFQIWRTDHLTLSFVSSQIPYNIT